MKPVAWPHAPVHRLSEAGTFMVTAGTFRKEHFFRGDERCAVLQRGLLKVCEDHGWSLEAWAVFSNHYHFVAHSPVSRSAEGLSQMLGELHSKTAVWVNRLDDAGGRKVWHNFWETRLTRPTSYLARLNYVHQNAVHHGLVGVAKEYPWCSASWFERTASAAMVKTIYGFGLERVRMFDEFEVA